MHRWLRLALDALFPPDCGVCDRPLPAGIDAVVCEVCLAAMRPPVPPLCVRCGVPLRDGTGLCVACRRRAPRFASACSVGLYRPGASSASGEADPLTISVQRLKYARRRELARVLGGLLAARYPFAADAVIVAVPLHRLRLRSRGFNQAALLAAELARRRALTLADRALVRRRQTRAQPGLDAAARLKNLTGAFEVRAPDQVKNRAVVLVDDVLTTGATANACAAVLLRAGALRVDVYTVGRAP